MKCFNKSTYRTFEEANAAKLLAKQRGEKYLVVYSCTDCGHFHIGHNFDDEE